MKGSHENAGIKVAAGRVTAVTRRAGSPVQTDRRSGVSGPTIGSHTPPKTTIFSSGSELEKVMGHSSENGVFGGPNSVRPMVFVCLCGLVELGPPTFSSSRVPPGGMNGSLGNMVFMEAARAWHLHPTGAGTPPSRFPGIVFPSFQGGAWQLGA
ncbi:MAG TPA: hypothetical protein VMW38_18395 [Terriglobia bacterium]|nr:hypothetical protein [Terriglobia bacterium]